MEVKTTKFIIDAAKGIPALEKISVNGLILTDPSCQGIKAATIKVAPR